MDFQEMTIGEIKTWLSAQSMISDKIEKNLLQDPRSGVHKLMYRWKKTKEQDHQLTVEHDRLLSYERSLSHQGVRFVAGIDEVGRGPLAGPVVTAAVILPENARLIGLTDSKKLSLKKRHYFYELIKQTAVSWHVGLADQKEIDQLNIYQATRLAMKRAVSGLDTTPEHLLVDAMNVPVDIHQTSIIKGDANSLSIAAASVMAKVTRDRMMSEYHKDYPMYHFDENAGYGTKKHLTALKEYGPSPLHRKSFAPVMDSLKNK